MSALKSMKIRDTKFYHQTLRFLLDTIWQPCYNSTYPWHLHLAVWQGPPNAVVVYPLSPSELLLSEVLRADTDEGAGIGHFRLDATAFVKANVCHHLLVLHHLSHHVQLGGWVRLVSGVSHNYITMMPCIRVFSMLIKLDI